MVGDVAFLPQTRKIGNVNILTPAIISNTNLRFQLVTHTLSQDSKIKFEFLSHKTYILTDFTWHFDFKGPSATKFYFKEKKGNFRKFSSWLHVKNEIIDIWIDLQNQLIFRLLRRKIIFWYFPKSRYIVDWNVSK